MSNDYWNSDARIDQPGMGGVVTRNWQEVWQTAVTSPSLETYLDLLRTSGISLNRAATWMYIVYIISIVLSGIAQALWGDSLNNILVPQSTTSDTEMQSVSPLALLICSPILAAIGVLLWVIGVGITHLIATMLFGGRGSFDQLAFLFAAFQAPLGIVSALLGMIPVVGACISLPLGIYGFFLTVIALNAAHQIGWVQSVIALLLPAIVIFGCVFVCIIALASSASTANFIMPLLSLF